MASASERLRELSGPASEALEELSGDAGWAHAYQPGGEDAPDRQSDVKVILDALPLIADVVEAAEEVEPFLPPARQWLPKALTALRDALEEK